MGCPNFLHARAWCLSHIGRCLQTKMISQRGARACAVLARHRPSLARIEAAVPGLVVGARWNQQASAESHKFDETDGVRRRLLYRSKQRGWLEMDIMLGNWAAQNLSSLDKGQLAEFSEVLDMENPDLF